MEVFRCIAMSQHKSTKCSYGHTIKCTEKKTQHTLASYSVLNTWRNGSWDTRAFLSSCFYAHFQFGGNISPNITKRWGGKVSVSIKAKSAMETALNRSWCIWTRDSTGENVWQVKHQICVDWQGDCNVPQINTWNKQEWQAVRHVFCHPSHFLCDSRHATPVLLGVVM